MSDRGEQYRCRYCGFKATSSGGLSSHVSQSSVCLDQIVADNRPPSHTQKRPFSPTLAASDFSIDQPDEAPLYSSLLGGQRPAKQPRVEAETVEFPEIMTDVVFEDFKPTAGKPQPKGPSLCSDFERLQQTQRLSGQEPWAPFSSVADWDYARWIMGSDLSQRAINDMLGLDLVSRCILLLGLRWLTNVQLRAAAPSFHDNRALLKKIDSIPTGPPWEHVVLSVEGKSVDNDGTTVTETAELWKRDPVECVRDLLSNPAFKNQCQYKPRKAFTNRSKTERVYSEMWTGKWWWRTQVFLAQNLMFRSIPYQHCKQKSLPKGATIAAVMIASDKTNLTRFSGDKYAWPVYITLGNIDKSTRRKPSKNAVILLGYLPVTKLDKILKTERSQLQYQLFHNCMKELLAPLIKAGSEGVKMLCSDGEVRLVFPILSAYVADHPEQCLVACCKENRCPKCLVSSVDRGNPVQSQLRDARETLETLREAHLEMDDNDTFNEHGLRPVDPFWKDLPHCDIFSTFTPDLLHQLHKGVFGDHISNWACTLVRTENEVDHRCKSMTRHPSLRHFRNGISIMSQWTGREYKELEKIFLGVIAGAVDSEVASAVRTTLDFMYYAHFERHTDSSLQKLADTWHDFHEKKKVFIDHNVRDHFNIPKIHSMQHYLHMIQSHGTADNFNTELPERLHIDIAKEAFKHTNKREYISQMRVRLRRHEAVRKFTAYLLWAVEGYVPGGKKTNQVDPAEANPDMDVQLPDNEEDSNPADASSHSTNTTALRHHTAVKPPFTMTLPDMKSALNAQRFDEALERFLHKSGSLHPYLQQAIENAHYPVFKQFTVSIPSPPQVTSEPFIRDTIHARKDEPGGTVLAKPDLPFDDNEQIRWWDIKGERTRE